MGGEDYQGALIEIKPSSYALKPARYSTSNFSYIQSSMKPYIVSQYSPMKAVNVSSKYHR